MGFFSSLPSLLPKSISLNANASIYGLLRYSRFVPAIRSYLRRKFRGIQPEVQQHPYVVNQESYQIHEAAEDAHEAMAEMGETLHALQRAGASHMEFEGNLDFLEGEPGDTNLSDEFARTFYPEVFAVPLRYSAQIEPYTANFMNPVFSDREGAPIFSLVHPGHLGFEPLPADFLLPDPEHSNLFLVFDNRPNYGLIIPNLFYDVERNWLITFECGRAVRVDPINIYSPILPVPAGLEQHYQIHNFVRKTVMSPPENPDQWVILSPDESADDVNRRIGQRYVERLHEASHAIRVTEASLKTLRREIHRQNGGMPGPKVNFMGEVSLDLTTKWDCGLNLNIKVGSNVVKHQGFRFKTNDSFLKFEFQVEAPELSYRKGISHPQANLHIPLPKIKNLQNHLEVHEFGLGLSSGFRPEIFKFYERVEKEKTVKELRETTPLVLPVSAQENPRIGVNQLVPVSAVVEKPSFSSLTGIFLPLGMGFSAVVLGLLSRQNFTSRKRLTLEPRGPAAGEGPKVSEGLEFPDFLDVISVSEFSLSPDVMLLNLLEKRLEYSLKIARDTKISDPKEYQKFAGWLIYELAILSEEILKVPLLDDIVQAGPHPAVEMLPIISESKKLFFRNTQKYLSAFYDKALDYSRTLSNNKLFDSEVAKDLEERLQEFYKRFQPLMGFKCSGDGEEKEV